MEVGDKFPEFVLKDENGNDFNSSELNGIRYVIYFYPRDNTPGCTREAQEFTASFGSFMLRNIPIIGVSKDSVESHKKFSDKNSLKIKLLSDPDHSFIEKAGAWGEKKSYGRINVGTIRTTYIIGKDGTVEAVWKNVRLEGHVDKVLEKAVALSKKN